MTLFIADVASYQGNLAAADVKRAGFGAVNLKVSHGLGDKSVHPDLAGWVTRARAIGLGICTFHYLTGDAPGEEQAERTYRRLAALDLLYGTAHQLDVESTPPPPLSSVRGYLERMTTLLQRPVALYTGDWWWRPKGWNVSDLTPYLWSAPGDGYLSGYPGDTSPQWTAGYGGWPKLSIMQHAVGTLSYPDGTRGTIEVSKSAIRDTEVWRSLTEGRRGMSYAPASLITARTFYITTLKKASFTINPAAVGIVGDDSHAASGTSYHLGKDALKAGSYSVAESSRDSKPTNAAMALDLGAFRIAVKGKVYDLPHFSRWLVVQCAAGTADTADIREVIYSPDGKVVKRWDRLKKRTTGDSSHTAHTHESWFRDSENRDKTAHLRRYFTEIGLLEDDNVLNDADKKWIADQIKTQITAAVAALKASDVATADDLLGALIGDKALPGRTVGDVLRDVAKLRGVLIGDPADTKNAALDPASPLAKLLGQPAASERLAAAIAELRAAIGSQSAQ